MKGAGAAGLALIALGAALLVVLLAFDHPTAAQSTRRLFAPVAARGAALALGSFSPTGNISFAGSTTYERVDVPAGVTVSTAGDVTIGSASDIVLAGAVETDGGALTLSAVGDVVISGTIAARADATGRGTISISGRSVRIEAADPATVVVTAPGDLVISTNAATGATRSAAEDPPGTTVAASIYTQGPPGGEPVTTTDGTHARGAHGRNAGGVTIFGPVTVLADASILTGSGAPGAEANATVRGGCPGVAATATGGNGGDGGGVALGFHGAEPDRTFKVVMNGRIQLGDGGRGGVGQTTASDGDRPGCPGGDAIATGGDAGNGGALLVPADATLPLVRIARGNGGTGGGALVGGGRGAKGAFPDNPNGTRGGNLTLQGGRGGSAAPGARIGEGGNGGGVVIFIGGSGGDGANGCSARPFRVGGDGGRGGAANARGGAGGRRFTDAQADSGVTALQGALNGGSGGNGTTPGAGGDAGVALLEPPAEDERLVVSLRDGGRGLICTDLTFGGQGDGGTLVVPGQPPGTQFDFRGTGFTSGAAVTINGTSDQGDTYGPIRGTVGDDGTFTIAVSFWVSEDQTVTFTATDAAGRTVTIVLRMRKG